MREVPDNPPAEEYMRDALAAMTAVLHGDYKSATQILDETDDSFELARALTSWNAAIFTTLTNATGLRPDKLLSSIGTQLAKRHT